MHSHGEIQARIALTSFKNVGTLRGRHLTQPLNLANGSVIFDLDYVAHVWLGAEDIAMIV